MTQWFPKLITLALVFTTTVNADSPADPKDWFTAQYADADLLILGTFHFKDAGLDSYKPEVDVDIMSEERQAELGALLDQLAAYKPNKVLIEVDFDRNDEFNERYRSYLAGSYELGPNEVYQVGFRLARRLGHKRLYSVDADGRHYPDLPENLDEWAQLNGQTALLNSPWGDRYMALYRADDHAKARQTLIDTMLYMNSPDRLRMGHGHYLLRDIALGDETSYPGADRVTGWWYNRNLRIFANIVRFTEPGDRLLLLIGAGHVPILHDAASSSPEYNLIEVKDILE